ncbi:MAG: hypothetical protein ACI4V7_02550 [Succinivibrionaceae bacterium]
MIIKKFFLLALIISFINVICLNDVFAVNDCPYKYRLGNKCRNNLPKDKKVEKDEVNFPHSNINRPNRKG